MKVQLVHKLEFHSTTPPTIGELSSILRHAYDQGFTDDTPVHVRAGEDGRDHDYFFYATIGSQPAEVLDAAVN
jgi:hypothetical protein